MEALVGSLSVVYGRENYNMKDDDDFQWRIILIPLPSNTGNEINLILLRDDERIIYMNSHGKIKWFRKLKSKFSP